MAEIVSLAVADSPALWLDLGFAVSGGQCWIGSIRHELGAAGEGVVAWRLRDVEGLSELPVAAGAVDSAPQSDAHRNGVVALDHVVVRTPDLDRTIEAFEGAGVELRRTRDAGTAESPLMQAFFKLGAVVVEVIGSPVSRRPGPAMFAGLAFTVADLDTTAAVLGARLRPAKPAVQPGRSIATLDRAAGSTVPMAFMSAASRPAHADRDPTTAEGS